MTIGTDVSVVESRRQVARPTRGSSSVSPVALANGKRIVERKNEIKIIYIRYITKER